MDLTPILTMLFDLIKVLVPSKTGTKFLLTLGGLGAVLYLALEDKATPELIQAFGYILIAYYVADIICKYIERRKNAKETTSVDDSTSDSV